MARGNFPLFAFNRGVVSPLSLARVDVKRMALSAETQKNWMPRVLGSMMLRPGWQYLVASSGLCKFISFEKSVDDQALIELSDGFMRIIVDDAVLTRPTVTTAITNGSFDTDLSGWTDNDDGGATSAWATGGYMSLTGDGTNFAIRDQHVTTVETGTVHALSIIVYQGVCSLRVGSSSGDDDYVEETQLLPGRHSIAFTPSGDFYVRLMSAESYPTLIDECVVETGGEVLLATPWAASDLDIIRVDQSADVIFVACAGAKQHRIERRDNNSWSIVDYVCNDGPFRTENLGPVTITPSAITGSITLTASKPLFKSGHVGALFKLSSAGQTVTQSVSAENVFTDPIKVTGVGDGRTISIAIVGTFVGSITLQRSLLAPGDWNDMATYTTAQTVNYNDDLDNQVAYYRIGIKSGDYTSGTAILTMTFSAGSITGIARVTGFTSSTVVDAITLQDFGAAEATDIWSEGAWSDYRGYPTSVALYDGRLWWSGKGNVWGSVSDAYDSFDDETVGDSGPISRTIGSGLVDTINYLLPLKRLVLGAQSREIVIRSSDFDEPITPTNFNMKTVSTNGSSGVAPVAVDDTGIFVSRSGTRIFQLSFSGQVNDYEDSELSILSPEICQPGVVRMAVQRNPDTRIHLVRSDGTVVVLIFDKAESTTCFIEVETDGFVRDVVIQHGGIEDSVYYHVQRTINGSTVYYLEKWALETEAVGGNLNKMADSFIVYSGVSTSTITGLDHLEGEDVVVWGDGVDLGSFQVSSGSISLGSTRISSAIVGLPYEAIYKSTKLAYAAQAGTALVQRKRLDHVGLILANTHAQGIQYGSDEDNLDDLPMVELGAIVGGDTIHETYDADSVEFNGTWATDSRLVLKAQAPRPCTVLAAVISLETHEKI